MEEGSEIALPKRMGGAGSLEGSLDGEDTETCLRGGWTLCSYLLLHTRTQVCVQPILHPIHMGLAPCRHLAQTTHSKIFVKKQFLFGHSVSPTSRSCLKLFPLYQKGLPQLAQPHYQSVDAIASLQNSLRFHFFSGFCNSKLVTSSPPPPSSKGPPGFNLYLGLTAGFFLRERQESGNKMPHKDPKTHSKLDLKCDIHTRCKRMHHACVLGEGTGS